MVTKILHTHSDVDIPFKVPCADRFCFWSCNRRPGCVLNCVAVGKTTLTNFWLKSIINTYSMITETEHQIYCGLLGPAQYFLRILIHDNNKISQNSHFDDAIDVNTALEFGRTVIAAWCPTSAPFICLFVDCPVNLPNSFEALPPHAMLAAPRQPHFFLRSYHTHCARHGQLQNQQN